MNMNRRAFFRFFGRASGTAAAVVVGGAAVLPTSRGWVELKEANGSVKTLVQIDNPYTSPSHSGYNLNPPLADVRDDVFDFKKWHIDAVMRKMWYV